MYTPSARRGTFLLVVILLLISILLEQAIAGVCPWLSQVGGVRPMIVFLDIPLEAPVTIDWLPVGFIFISFYSIISIPRNEDTRYSAGNANGARSAGRGEGTFGRGWAILGRWWLLLILMLTGGGIYYGLSGFLPKEIRNGIESIGMRADLTLPYPSGETIHLHGSMIMLGFFILGWRLLINKAIPPAIARPVEELAVATASAAPKSAAAKPAAAKSAAAKPLPRAAIPPPIVFHSNYGEFATIKSDHPHLRPRPLAGIAASDPARGPAPVRPVVAVAKPIIADTPPPPPTPAETAVPNRGRIAMRIPEPVEVKSSDGRPCVYVAMPAGFQRKRTSYPCVVDGGIRPAGIRQKELMQ